MTRDDIRRMASKAGFSTDSELIWGKGWEISPFLARFAALVAAAEREACAKLCETEGARTDASWASCAAAIRARGNA